MGDPYFQAKSQKFNGNSNTLSFLAGSAKAKTSHYNSIRSKNVKTDIKSKFNRDIEASFERKGKIAHLNRKGNESSSSSSSGKISEEAIHSFVEDQKKHACTIADSLPIGPKQIVAPDDDLHFNKLEPNTGIELTKRYTSNKDISGYLEGRVLVPISTLYSICLPGDSQDGKGTVPIDGDWMIIGAIAQRKKLLNVDGYKLDKNNKKINEQWLKSAYDAYIERKNGQEPDLNDVDNPYNEVKREIRPTQSQTYTLVDIGQPLENRDTAGDSMLEITVYKADDVQIDHGGNRRYTGGSGGAFEMMEKLGAGTVICILNPMITKGPFVSLPKKSFSGFDPNEDQEVEKSESISRRSDSKMIWLKPRRFENVITIGNAKNVGQCEAQRKDGQKCNAFIDLRTKMKACAFHCSLSASKSKKGRQEFANSTSKMPNFLRNNHTSSYAFSDGMSFGQSKAYISKGSKSLNNLSRIETNFGREAEARRLRQSQNYEEQKMGLKLLDNQKKRSSTENHPIKSHQTFITQKTDEPINSLSQNHGAKLVKDALQQLQKRTLNLNPATSNFLNKVRPQEDLLKRKREENVGKIKNDFFLIGNNKRRTHAPLEKTSKLLSRHTASADNLPKPIMRFKQDTIKNKSSVRTPKGENFYPIDFSDDELDNMVSNGLFDENDCQIESDDDDFAIISTT